MTDHSHQKLGKKAPLLDDRTLLMANYFTDTLPTAPKQFGYNADIKDWGMMGNDTIGDCTCASVGHMLMGWTDDNKKMFTPTTKQIVDAYSAITGYNEVTGANDNGAECLTVLNYFRNTGIAGRKLGAYAALEPGNHDHIKQAIYLFGGVYIGVGLPISAQKQSTWSVPIGGAKGNGLPDSWGGHCIPVIHYTAQYLYCVTWGGIKRMTWGFWQAYCDEAYALFSTDFLSNGKAPNGFDMAALQGDLKALGK